MPERDHIYHGTINDAHIPGCNMPGGKEKNTMFEKFGEMDTAEEICATAEGLRDEGDRESLMLLARENGIDGEIAGMYFDGEAAEFCDAATAAIGKVEAEAAGFELYEIMNDWLEYIKASCLEDVELARAVRRKGKSLVGCLGAILKWSYDNRKDVCKDIVSASGIAGKVQLGIPSMGRAKKLIREYYMKQGGGKS